MRIFVRQFLPLIAILGLLFFSMMETVGRQSGFGATPPNVSIDIALEPGELLTGAAVGHLKPGLDPAIVIGTSFGLGAFQGRVRVLYREGDRYSEAWRFTNAFGGFDSAIIADVNGDGHDDLTTLWRAGSGGYLDVHVFEWSGGSYREIWKLDRDIAHGQLTQGAGLRIEQIDAEGHVQLVIRAPNVPQGSGAYGPVAHQVSIYRWDVKKRTFVLFQRFIDPKPSWG